MEASITWILIADEPPSLWSWDDDGYEHVK